MTEPEIERGTLADAFKGAAGQRTAGLGGILGAAPRRPAVPNESAPVTAPATTVEKKPAVAFVEPADAAAPPVAAQVAQVPAAAPVVASVLGDDPVESVPAYVEPDVLAAVRAAKRKGVPAGQADLTYDELLLDAIDELGSDRIREAFHPAAVEGAGVVSRRVRRVRGTGGQQIQLRLSRTQQQQLAVLIEVVGAPSRSAFVSTVFRLAYVKR